MTLQNTATPVDHQVRERMQAWAVAFASKDVDAMMSFYAPEGFTAFDLMPPFEFGGGDEWRANWEIFYEAFEGPIVCELADLLVYVKEDMAVARAAVHMVGTMYAQSMDTWVRSTNCFRLIGGEWLMFHDHVSWPIDFATGTAMMDLTPIGGAHA
jgi:ketosteroid isomerase-like protein